MIPENVQEKVNSILKNEYFSESEGDEVVIIPKENGIFYAYVKSNKRGVGQMVISGGDLSFLSGGSYLSSDQLLEKFKNGDRSKES